MGRIRRAPGRKPHGVHTFKLSNDPRCAAKLDDIVRLYLPPSEFRSVSQLTAASEDYLAQHNQ